MEANPNPLNPQPPKEGISLPLSEVISVLNTLLSSLHEAKFSLGGVELTIKKNQPSAGMEPTSPQEKPNRPGLPLQCKDCSAILASWYAYCWRCGCKINANRGDKPTN